MKSERREPFGERLRRLREAAGFSREELAERARLSASAIGAIERGERHHPYPHTVRALADALDLVGEQREALFAAVPGQGVAAPDALPITLEEASSSLPLPPTPLVGRDGELAALKDRLAQKEVRLLTLIGPGGVGKTRLALKAAGAAEGSFEDGVAFVALAPLHDPGLVVGAIAVSLGVQEAPGRPLRETLLAHLCTKRLLLVLDNFEHLAEAATDVAALLSASPNLKVLTTSRVALGLRGEKRFAVPPLEVPELARLPAPEEVSASPAVRLFVDRARDVAPGFEITRGNAAAVAAICRRLDGLPLAIELAAALVRVLPPREILARLDRALPLLVGGARDLPERQRTMRSAIAWSYDLLDEDERAAFRRLSVFSGSFSLPAAEAVLTSTSAEFAAPEERGALEVLSSLLDKSLLSTSADVDDAEEARFAMLETIRAYGLEQLAQSAEEGAVRERHAAFYLRLAEEAEPHLNALERDVWLGRLEKQHEQLRSALSWSWSEGRGEMSLRLSGALFWFWFHGGQWSEGRAWLERALGTTVGRAGRTASGTPVPAIRAKALRGAGALAAVQGQYAAGSVLLEESEALWRSVGDSRELALTLLFRNTAGMGLGEVERAREFGEESVRLFRETGDAFGLSASLAALGVVLYTRQDYPLARCALEESVAIARDLKDDWLLSLPMRNLGMVALAQGDLEQGKIYIQQSLEHFAGRPGEQWFVAMSLESLASLAVGRGDHVRAARLYGASEALREAVGFVAGPFDAEGHGRGVAAAREALGEGVFATARAEGRTLSPNQAVAEALGKSSSLSPPE